jgi:chromate reductase, NAD(P)H dehydrogenase (quinone)
MTKNIVAFAGSTRKDSLNKKLVQVAAQGARDAGAQVTYIDLGDYPMPFYDGDFEASQGMPEHAARLKALFLNADGFLIASPEYNSSYSAVLKNAIDWLSRPSSKGEAGLAAFAGKKASLMAISPGALGGLRGLYALRELLMNVNVLVHPVMQAVGNGFEVFDEQGAMKDSKKHDSIIALGKQLVDM